MGNRIARVAFAAALLASAAVGATGAPVRAASVTFGAPTASSSFGKGVDFTQPYSGGGTFSEVDVAIDYPGSLGLSITKLDNPGSTSFTYHLDASTGQLQPNTQLVAHFEVTFADGTVQAGPEIRVTYLDDRFQWRTKTGKVVRLHWYQGDDAFAASALQMGEQGIASAAAFMGVNETQPIDFYIYADQAPFYDALGPSTRENVGGEANTTTRTLFALIAPNELSFASTVVPHELTHVVFDEVTRNPYHYPPHWLNEGIAVYVSQGYDSSDKQLVASAAADGSLMPLEAIRGQFPTTQDRFYLAYAESVSAVDYFMRTYGHDDLVKLLRAFGTGASADEAFNAAIGMGVDAFDKAWMNANGVSSIQSFGPRPAPIGPVPSGWTSSGLAGGTAAPTQAPSAGSPAATATPAPQGGSAQSEGGIPTVLLLAVAFIGAIVVALGLVAVVMRRRSSPRGEP
jgi:hypothetical protein